MEKYILLHGALGTADDLSGLKTELEKRGALVFTFNFSGHGSALFKEDFGISIFAEELKQFMFEKHIQTPIVFGYSMGGYVALDHATLYPGSLKAIVTLGTKFNWTDESAEQEIRNLDPDHVLSRMPELATVLKQKHGEKWRELLLKTTALMKKISVSSNFWLNNLANLDLPVQIGLGDRDKMVSLEESRAVFHRIEKASFYILPNTKHPIEKVNSSVLAELMFDLAKYLRT